MYLLFHTQEPTLKLALEHISEDMIRNCCHPKFYERGLAYFHDDAVEEIYFENENNLSAVVVGQKNYSVEIVLNNNIVESQCSCPFEDDVCKHIICVLFYLQHRFDKIDTSRQSSENQFFYHPNNFEAYLQSLSKEELIKLLHEHAPKNFKKEIENRFLSEPDAEKLLLKTSKSINKFFGDTALLYSPTEFEETLVNKLEELRGIWDKKSQPIADLLLTIIKKINDVQDEGYLYSENYDSGHYGGEEYFEGQDLTKYIIDFIKQLPLTKRFEFISEIKIVIDGLSYDFSVANIPNKLSELFTASELPDVKEYYLARIKNGKHYNEEEFYKILSPLFSDTEKEYVLKQTSSANGSLTLALAKFHETQNRINLAMQVLDDFIRQYGDDHSCPKEIFTTRLNYGLSQNEDRSILSNIAQQALSKHADSEMLNTVTVALPEYAKQFEAVLKTENESQLFKYFETANRLDEAVELIKEKNISDWETYPFWCKHKQKFKQDAQDAFEKRITENLQLVKDSAYQTVTETLLQLRQINPELCQKWLMEIKTTFSRRRNLMQMLQKNFR